MIDMTTLGADPSVVALHEFQGSVYAFVLCFLSDQLYIVDVDMMQVLVRTTGAGPHAIAFDKTEQHAFIANFRESTITVIQAIPPFDHVGFIVPDPVHPDNPEKAVRAKVRIGKPNLPKGHS